MWLTQKVSQKCVCSVFDHVGEGLAGVGLDGAIDVPPLPARPGREGPAPVVLARVEEPAKGALDRGVLSVAGLDQDLHQRRGVGVGGLATVDPPVVALGGLAMLRRRR